MQRRKRVKLTRADLELANVGSKFFGVTLDKIPEELAHRQVITEYTRKIGVNTKDGVGLLLYGDHDLGKTAAGVVVIKAALLSGYTALFVEAARLQSLAYDRRRFNDEMTWIERAETVDCLVLDDLGLDHGKDFKQLVVESLLRARSNASRPTIITTNLGSRDVDGLFEAISDRYGRGVSGIVRENCAPVRVKGKNWRAEKAAALSRRFAPKKAV